MTEVWRVRSSKKIRQKWWKEHTIFHFKNLLFEFFKVKTKIVLWICILFSAIHYCIFFLLSKYNTLFIFLKEYKSSNLTVFKLNFNIYDEREFTKQLPVNHFILSWTITKKKKKKKKLSFCYEIVWQVRNNKIRQKWCKEHVILHFKNLNFEESFKEKKTKKEQLKIMSLVARMNANISLIFLKE